MIIEYFMCSSAVLSIWLVQEVIKEQQCFNLRLADAKRSRIWSRREKGNWKVSNLFGLQNSVGDQAIYWRQEVPSRQYQREEVEVIHPWCHLVLRDSWVSQSLIGSWCWILLQSYINPFLPFEALWVDWVRKRWDQQSSSEVSDPSWVFERTW